MLEHVVMMHGSRRVGQTAHKVWDRFLVSRRQAERFARRTGVAVGDLRWSYAEGTTENACILLRCEGGEVTAVIAYARAQVWGQEPSKLALGHVVDG